MTPDRPERHAPRPPQLGLPSRVAAIVTVVVAAVAAFPATWWTLGRVDHSGDWIVDPDYAIRPPIIDRTLAHAIGAGSAVLVCVGVGVLVSMVVMRRWPPCALAAAAIAIAPAGYGGMAGHMLTAPVIGANIGAGLVALGAGPLGLVLLVATVFTRRACRRSRR